MYIEVKNLNGTTKNKPVNDKTWLEGWMRVKGVNSIVSCSNFTCICSNMLDLVGAHVKKLDSNEHYIVPLCKSCNNKSSNEIFWVEENDLVLVSEINS